MSKHGKGTRFSQTWATQTQLGKHFNMTARAVGQLMADLGLRTYDETQRQYLPTQRALDENLCISTPLKDGTPFFMWNKWQIAALIQERTRVRALSDKEVEYYEVAQSIIHLEREAEETGIDKLYYLMLESIRPRDFATINQQLERLGSPIRLGQDDNAREPGEPPDNTV